MILISLSTFFLMKQVETNRRNLIVTKTYNSQQKVLLDNFFNVGEHS